MTKTASPYESKIHRESTLDRHCRSFLMRICIAAGCSMEMEVMSAYYIL
nr:MAG TPA: hypothetical protein [Caudoviricetes sp.]